MSILTGQSTTRVARQRYRLKGWLRLMWEQVSRSVFVRQVLLAPLEPLTHDSLFRIRFLAIALLLTEPAYYLFWGYIVPQPAEDALLRLPSVLFATPLLFRRFHKWLGTKRMEWYWTALLTYSLPFAFFGLYRENGYNDVWMGAFVCGIYCLFIMTDWRLALLDSVVGVALACWTVPVLGAYRAPPIDHLGTLVFAYFTAMMLAMSDANLRFLRARAALATIGVMAHEFRTPLASAGVLVEALAYEPTANQSELFQARVQKLKAIFDSINTMIDYQISSTKIMGFPTQREVVSLAELVRSAVGTLPTASPSVRHCVEVVIVDDSHVRVNKALMRQVVYNLLTNAIKSVTAAGKGMHPGDVAILVDGDHHHVRLRVTDKGVGIAPENMPRLFEPFFSTSMMPAHGLGLTMCRNAITAFGGDIWCTSARGRGATFHVLLPRSARQPTPTTY